MFFMQKIRDVFGDMLFVPSSDEKPPLRFASPEDLKHKIIISDTPPKDAIHTQVLHIFNWLRKKNSSLYMA
jgi:phosphatidylinositol phospholipase C delta